VREYFEETPIFGRRDLILDHVQQLARNNHASKEGKETCMRESHMPGGRQA
jgi:hypothetical protein